MTQTFGYWDHIQEYEVDPSWRDRWTDAYQTYRAKFEAAKQMQYLGDFPLSLEIESSYYCNLECPFCSRAVLGEKRPNRHMAEEVWQCILQEAKAYALPSILMDHEAEALMNKRLTAMVGEAHDAGILDIWLHTNANLLTSARSRELITNGLTRINFSVDAVTSATYDKVRTGGNFERVTANIHEFLRLKRDLNATNLRVRLSFVVTKDNLSEKRAFLDQWSAVPGVNVITFQECQDFSAFADLEDSHKLSDNPLPEQCSRINFSCSLLWEMPVIDVDGNVIPCGAPVRSHNSEFILGNLLLGDTIASCWRGEKMERLRALHQAGQWYKEPTCLACIRSSGILTDPPA